ncbi:hypothetical protein WOLCODRAFT_135692 [Wolfiporia cocos MD-104 SS10]|uniref:C2H2-type domain-containing protein n=1 Tax=Wolfiporia cocos (strain MD-104) TaxID=742152 RepID=A0A2H3J6M7_WOLCO|nr:hypothetical protein WOLCODRAFT_135692 [Wolfiporia cocos MD-104 SS10]
MSGPFVTMWSYVSASANGACPITSAPVPQIQFKHNSGQSPMGFIRPSQMQSTGFLPTAAHHAPIPQYEYSHTSHYQSVMSQQPSYERSSAPRTTHALPPQYLPYHPSLSGHSPQSSYSGSGPTVGSPSDASQQPMEADHAAATATAGQAYSNGGYAPAGQHYWGFPETSAHYDDMYTVGSYDGSAAMNAREDVLAFANWYLKREEPSSPTLNFPASYGSPGTDSAMDQYAPFIGQHSIHNVSSSPTGIMIPSPPAMSFGFGTQVPQSYAADSPAYTIASSPTLQYPPAAETVPRFVHPAQVSPEMSPAADFPPLHPGSASPPALDPRFTVSSPPSAVNSPTTPTGFDVDTAGEGLAFPTESEQSDLGTVDPNAGEKRRHRVISFTSTSSSSSEELRESESGESEKEEDQDGAEDDEYIDRSDARLRPRTRTISSSSASRADSRLRRINGPVPIPNLTKKSRGRHVPTYSSLASESSGEKNMRQYRCEVDGCNKCFARGEHLKRHIRSIHTNEKPHKCPFPSCDKDFSRHDNLRQHMRVHKKGRHA